MDLHEFETLVAARARPIAGYFRRHGARDGDVEELAQESLLLCWTHRERIQPGREASFLYGIARNLLLVYHRQQDRRRHVIQEGVPEEVIAAQPENGDATLQLMRLLAREQADSLQRILEKLPQRQREVIQALYFEEKTEQIAAKSLGISRATISTHHRRALARLRQLVEFAEGD